MSGQHSDPPSILPSSRRVLPLLLLLFVGSGCAALIYEIVWFQLLQLVIGSSAVSLGILLGTFMGGMCLGSIALPRLISARRHPLRVYAVQELGIGILGIAVLFAVPLVSRLYVTNAGQGLTGILLRGAVCAVCLLPPTLLMGATLPAMARWIETTPQGLSWMGFFYAGNIAGAVFGCLLAGFYLLRVHDLATATGVAATFNGTVAMIGFGLAALTPRHAPAGEPARSRASQDAAIKVETSPEGPAVRLRGLWAVYVAIALSGLCALGGEVIWTRQLSLLLGGTVYTFSIILAVFLMGLGIGSSAGSFLSRGAINPRIALACCQMLLTAAVAWTAYMLANSLPYWPINPSLSKSPWFNFQIDLMRCIWAILPPTCLWGASFPLALAAVASRGQDPGRLVGGVYAANTVGAIIGAMGCAILLIGWVGTQHSQRLLIGLSALAALLLFAPFLTHLQERDSAPRGRRGEEAPASPSAARESQSALGQSRVTSEAAEFMGKAAGAVLLAAAAGFTVLLAWSVPEVPGELIAHGRYLPTKDGEGKILYAGEGMNASIAVTELSGGARNFHVSGKVEASSEPQDMRLQRMLGHLPALLHPQPRSVLVVGFGAGITAGSFVVHPDIEKIVICEIEPLIPRVVAQYFGKENYNVLKDPRVKVIYDDARHYILTTKDKFDIITSDPIHPWVKGAATLYTQEYFELVKRHLNPGGMVTQWVPLYESNLGAVKSEIATFFDVFPGGTIWSNDDNGAGYDVVLLGRAEVLKIDLDELQERLNRDDPVAASLKEVGFRSVFSLFATYAGQGSDLRQWLRQAEINRDRNLRLQYLAGMGLNVNQSRLIYDDLLVYRRFPEELFAGSDQRKQMLKLVLERSESSK